MSYFAEPNHIEYDAWFDENIDPIDLMNYLDEKEFSDSVHDKFHKISTRNLTIGASDNFHWSLKDFAFHLYLLILLRICSITFSS